jgi:recombinational DNA repair protein (RecF pathway)
MSKRQQELFDGFVRLRECLKCKRKMHSDPNNRYRTREAGLCFTCLREFDASDHWTVASFLNHDQQTMAEFIEAAADLDSFLEDHP